VSGKKKGPLNIFLDHLEFFPGGFGQRRDVRLERALQHPAQSKLTLWCEEDRRDGSRCDTLLAQVFATSEGYLWEAVVQGPDEYDLALRKVAGMTDTGAGKTDKIPSKLHARHVWLDGTDYGRLEVRCKRHGATSVGLTELRRALEDGKRHAERRGGSNSFR
jgi:hypothetical protein